MKYCDPAGPPGKLNILAALGLLEATTTGSADCCTFLCRMPSVTVDVAGSVDDVALVVDFVAGVGAYCFVFEEYTKWNMCFCCLFISGSSKHRRISFNIKSSVSNLPE